MGVLAEQRQSAPRKRSSERYFCWTLNKLSHSEEVSFLNQPIHREKTHFYQLPRTRILMIENAKPYNRAITRIPRGRVQDARPLKAAAIRPKEMVFMEAQPLKAPEPIVCTPSGIKTSTKLEQ
jgi:hypothetical protein